jgi:hypothetical protein
MGFRTKEDAVYFAEKQGQSWLCFVRAKPLSDDLWGNRLGLLCVSSPVGWAILDH